MIWVRLLVDLAFTIIVIHQVLYWVYLWQLKEYRLDRFRAGLRTREDWIRTFLESYDLSRWFRPKITVRSLVSAAVGIAVSLPPVFASDWVFKIASVLFNPVLTAISLGIVTPMFWVWKEETIKRATLKIRHFKGKVIGVTGSYGKSMTKEMLWQVLSSRFKVLATPKNVNSEIGIALTVMKQLQGDEDFFVVEMGAYKKGEIKRSCSIVHPDLGIITGIGDQHLDLFGSREAIREAKFELIEALSDRKNGFVADEDFSLAEARNIRVFRDHAEFVFEKQRFSVPLLGKSLVRNVVGVIKVCQRLGMDLGEIAVGVGKLDPNLIYPKIRREKSGIVVIDNSYNSSLEAFLSALEYLRVWNGYKKVVLTPGFIELGQNAEGDWKKVQAAAKDIDQLILTRKNKMVEFTKTDKTVVLLQGRVNQKIKDYVQSL